MFSNTFTLLSLVSLGSAHFLLNYPPSRGFDDDKAVTFPCGGFDTVSSNRTSWPATGGPIQLDMHHTQTNVEVTIALGPEPGNNYNIIMRPTLEEQGLGNFCLGMVSIPEGVNWTEGQAATIQVLSNGDPSGGLYQCADVTLTKTALASTDYASNCKNNTGVQISNMNVQGNANETSAEGASATSSQGAAPQMTVGAFVLGAAGLAGMAML